MSKPPNQKFYKKINLCWYFIKVGSNVRCTFYVGWGLNMSYLSLNLKIQKKIASHHISILSLTVLSNLQISISYIFSFKRWSHSLVTTMVSSPNPIFRTGSTDIGIKFEMRELEKNHTREFKFKGEVYTFLGLKNFIFHDAWMFLFGIKNKNVLLCKNLCCFKTNLRSLIILMNWMVGQRGEPKHILYSPCGSSLLTEWYIQQPWISSNKMITGRYIFQVSIFMYEG